MNLLINNIEAGANNLLINCAAVKQGDKILLVGEDCESPFFDPELCEDIVRAANKLGVESRVMLAKPVNDASQLPSSISEAMQTVDKTIFFSRLGDQARFVKTSGNSQKIVCYTLTRQHLASPFASVNYRSMKKMHDLLCELICSARTYKIESADGSCLISKMQQKTVSDCPTMTEFSLELFPVMIFPPIRFQNVQGKIVLNDFVLSSSTRAYSDSVFSIKTPIIATVENSRMVSFEGDPLEIEALKRQFQRAANITGGDAFAINSWHTGINPYTFYEGDPYQDLECWGTVSYGSPRYTHFHACGVDPGDVSLHIMGASISFDDELFWDQGKFVFLDRPDVQSLFTEKEQLLLNSSIVYDIGF
jgi:hypothetical protein